jgi:hypothetical protein
MRIVGTLKDFTILFFYEINVSSTIIAEIRKTARVKRSTYAVICRIKKKRTYIWII